MDSIKEIVRILLIPLSMVYGNLMRLRAWLYKNGCLKVYKSQLPVICVGNVLVGGNGKTPIVRYIVDFLIEQGRRPVILLRGYKGEELGPHLLTSDDSAKRVGDEARMLADQFGGRVAVVVAADRVAGAKFIEQNSFGDSIVLDDGFQHLALARDLNILVTSVSSPEEKYKLADAWPFPAGFLREFLGDAVARSDLIILNDRSGRRFPFIEDHLPLSRTIKKFKKATVVFSGKYSIVGFVDLQSYQRNEPRIVERLATDSVLLATSIANPKVIKESLGILGVSVIESVYAQDHAYHNEDLLTKLTEEHPHLPLLVTEKDACKLKPRDNCFVIIGKWLAEDKDKLSAQIISALS